MKIQYTIGVSLQYVFQEDWFMSMNLQKTIMDLRREKGYTQEKLAEMLGVTTAAVSKWECGVSQT